MEPPWVQSPESEKFFMSIKKWVWKIVVSQLLNQLHTALEDPSSNPTVSNFYNDHLQLTIEKTKKKVRDSFENIKLSNRLKLGQKMI